MQETAKVFEHFCGRHVVDFARLKQEVAKIAKDFFLCDLLFIKIDYRDRV